MKRGRGGEGLLPSAGVDYLSKKGRGKKKGVNHRKKHATLKTLNPLKKIEAEEELGRLRQKELGRLRENWKERFSVPC